jgi:hypothetical protein
MAFLSLVIDIMNCGDKSLKNYLNLKNKHTQHAWLSIIVK